MPCLMRWPGRIKPGTVCEELATMMDLLPTLAKLIGTELPSDRTIDGRDIGPLAFGDALGARSVLEILTCYPGLHATWFHRVAHALWNQGLRYPARLLSHISRWLTGIEIHPGAHIGRRFFIDHGMGVVIGETAEIGNDVLIYKGVVLGGVSLEKAKRHPTIGNGVVIGTNAIVLGPIQVGDNAQIGSGSVVVKPVPACATVVGIPGKVVKINGVRCQLKPDLHHEQLPDVDAESIRRLSDRIGALEAQIEELQAHVEEASRMEKAEVRGWA